MTRGHGARVSGSRPSRRRSARVRTFDPTPSAWCLSLALLSQEKGAEPPIGAASRGLYASVRGGGSPCRGVRHEPQRLARAPAPYDGAVERTTLPIFELGVLLLVAALAGWLARRLRLPAIVGYLAVGVLVSPFTPGYVAGPRAAPAPRRRRRRAAALRGRHRGRRGPPPARARPAPVGRAAPDRHHRGDRDGRRDAGRPAAVRGGSRGPRRRDVVERRHRQHHPEPAPDDDARHRGGAPRLERPPGHHRRRARRRPPRGLRRRGPAAASRRSPA